MNNSAHESLAIIQTDLKQGSENARILYLEHRNEKLELSLVLTDLAYRRELSRRLELEKLVASLTGQDEGGGRHA
jgi:hypothetical protein